MRYGRYGWSYLFLCWGLGVVFLWIGIDIFRHTTDWIGFVPAQLPFGLDRETTLKLTGLFDIAIGILLFLRWFPRITSLLAAVHLASVLVTQGVNAVLIRDIGLMMACLSLFVWPQHNSRRRWWKIWKRKSSSYDEE